MTTQATKDFGYVIRLASGFELSRRFFETRERRDAELADTLECFGIESDEEDELQATLLARNASGKIGPEMGL
jgi:hypothetical protein